MTIDDTGSFDSAPVCDLDSLLFLHAGGGSLIKKAALAYRAANPRSSVFLMVKSDEADAYKDADMFDKTFIIGADEGGKESGGLNTLISMRRMNRSGLVVATLPGGEISRRAVAYALFGGFDSVWVLDRSSDWRRLKSSETFLLGLKLLANLGLSAVDSFAALVITTAWVGFRLMRGSRNQRELYE